MSDVDNQLTETSSVDCLFVNNSVLSAGRSIDNVGHTKRTLINTVFKN